LVVSGSDAQAQHWAEMGGRRVKDRGKVKFLEDLWPVLWEAVLRLFRSIDLTSEASGFLRTDTKKLHGLKEQAV
jgi:hypothetical protein